MKSLITFICLFFTISTLSQVNSDLYLKYGKEHYETGYYLSAVEYLSKAIDLDSLNSDAYYYRGLCYKYGYKSDICTQALNDFAKSININSIQNYWEAYLYVGYVMDFHNESFQKRYPNINLIDSDVHKTAHHHLMKAYTLNPTAEMAEKIANLYLFNLDHYSLEFINLALKKYPSNYVLLKHRARSLMNTWEYDHAIEAYKELIKMNKKDGDLYNNILICMSRKRYMNKQEIDMDFYCKMIKKAQKYYRKEQKYEYCEEC